MEQQAIRSIHSITSNECRVLSSQPLTAIMIMTSQEIVQPTIILVGGSQTVLWLTSMAFGTHLRTTTAVRAMALYGTCGQTTAVAIR